MHAFCPSCSARFNDPQARFCKYCGHRLDLSDGPAPPIQPIELRQATVLYCDIVDSTALGLEVGIEKLAEIDSRFRGIVLDVSALHFEHRVVEFAGDGARVTFGHPGSREDAPECAVRCGLALVQAVREVRAAPQRCLQLRVGISFGTVVLNDPATASGSHSRDSVVGTVPALAARLAAAAPPGGVVIDQAMRKVVGHFFDVRDMGALRLKGFGDGVRCWLVTAPTALASRHGARRRARTVDALVGRDPELAQLRAAWRAAHGEGRGRAVMLMGDPGVGKSRLAHSLDTEVAVQGTLRLELDCTPRMRNTPLYPVSVLARHLADIALGDDADTVRRKASLLLGRWFEPARLDDALHYLGPLFVSPQASLPLSAESPELVRERVIEHVVGFVHLLARRSPLLMQFEDLQWSDPTTAEILARIVASTTTQAILVVITARPEAEALRLPQIETVALRALTDSASRELVRQMVPGHALSAETIEAIVARGEGMPLFLEELTYAAIEEAPSAAACGRVGLRETVPSSLNNVIQARLDRRPLLRNVTQAAAVLGRTFSLALLHELLGDPSAQMHAAIARLIDDGVLAATGDGQADRLRFKHALIQEAMYQTLMLTERQRLHAAASDILLRLPPGAPEASTDTLAFHLRCALRHEEAVRCLIAGSADTIARAAYKEAVGHCQAGLALADEIEDAARRRVAKRQLLIQLGVAQSALMGYAAPEVETAYRQARELCDGESAPEVLYPIIRGLATFYLVRGDLAAAYALSAQGMALAEQGGRPEQRIDAVSVHAYTSLYFGTLAECRGALDRCLALYDAENGRQLTYPVAQDAGTAALALLPTVTWLLGDAPATEAAIARGLAHVAERDRPFDTALLHAWTAGTRFTQRRYGEAARHAAVAVDTAQKYGYRDWLVTGQMMGLMSHAAQNEAPEAVAGVQQAMSGFAALGVGLNASYYLWGLARCLVRIGNVAAAREALSHGFQRALASGETRMNAELLIMQAELDDDLRSAVARLAEALALAETQGAVTTALRAALIIVARSGDDAAEVERAADWLRLLDGEGGCAVEAAWMEARLKEVRRWRRLREAMDGRAVPVLTS